MGRYIYKCSVYIYWYPMVVDNRRQERGRYLAGLRGFVNKIGDNLYRIKSASGIGEYVVKSLR